MGAGTLEQRTEALERQGRILRMRMEGRSLAAIAEVLGVSKQAVWETLKKALTQPKSETAELARALELARIDFLTNLIWPSEDTSPDLVPIPELLGLMEKRIRLLGLNAPERMELRAQQYVLDWGDENELEADSDAASA